MKELVKDLLFSLLAGLIIPALVLNLGAAILARRAVSVPGEEPAIETEAYSAQISLPMLLREGSAPPQEEDLDTYLVGVVLAEMPSYFEQEALKAQAVVARTYARKAYTTLGKHGDGSVCEDPTCCQGYISVDAYLASGGQEENVEKIRHAVRSTSGQVLTYDGELIEATYFSCSGGKTEAAVAVWGRDFPYLQSVESPGEENAAHFADTVVFSQEEFAAALALPEEEKSTLQVGPATYTEGGGIHTIVIGEKRFTGTELRSLLGLRSTAFSISVEADLVTITTKGYGHRVGMSQFGADAMAADGRSYREILAHYYPGTELTTIVR